MIYTDLLEPECILVDLYELLQVNNSLKPAALTVRSS